MSSDPQQREGRDQVRDYINEVLNFEKYIVPGACALAILVLFPWYMLRGGRLASWDLATIAILTLVSGHLIESLKVYQLVPGVRRNFKDFDFLVQGFFRGLTGSVLDKGQLVVVKNAVFSRMEPGERYEYTWNLLRWQKMVVLSALLGAGGIEWLLFALLSYLSRLDRNPFASDFLLILFRPQYVNRSSLYCEISLGIVLFVCAVIVWRYGLERQRKNNDTYFDSISKHGTTLLDMLSVRSKAATSAPQNDTGSN